jgi:hypothetical protein
MASLLASGLFLDSADSLPLIVDGRSAALLTTSLVSQRRGKVDTRRPDRGQQNRHCGDAAEHDWHGGQREGIAGADAVEEGSSVVVRRAR